MTTPLRKYSDRPQHRRSAALVAAAVATTGLALSAPAGATEPTDVVPAAGTVITCQTVGALTATSGNLLQREPVTIDGRGRAQVLFTLVADRVILIGADGTRYRFVGGGYDYVVYPTKVDQGAVVKENERFTFDIIGPHGVAGAVRFALHTGSDQVEHIHDTSTCQLPNI